MKKIVFVFLSLIFSLTSFAAPSNLTEGTYVDMTTYEDELKCALKFTYDAKHDLFLIKRVSIQGKPCPWPDNQWVTDANRLDDSRFSYYFHSGIVTESEIQECKFRKAGYRGCELYGWLYDQYGDSVLKAGENIRYVVTYEMLNSDEIIAVKKVGVYTYGNLVREYYGTATSVIYSRVR